MRITWCAALAICAAGSAWASDASQPAVPSENYSHAQTLVAIDGSRRLNLFCLGTGSPAVVFEAGLGSSGSVWRLVQGRVASFTRACAYDRAGYGFSDPASRPADATNVVDDLHTLVARAPIATPIVLVGHSLGGLFATLYAASYKSDVAGMVLVDPAFAHQWEAFAEHASGVDTSGLFARFRGITAGMRACRATILALGGREPGDKEKACLPSSDMPEHPDDVLLAALTRQWRQAGPNDAMISEAENFIATSEGEGHPPPDDNDLDAAPGKLGDLPLVVLTASRGTATFPGLTDAQREQFAAAWKEGHDALAQRSSHGKSVLVPDSGHFIQIEHPDVVVQAIRGVVDDARAALPH